MRLELHEDKDIAYGDHGLIDDGVTLLPSVENHNFGYVDTATRLGFVSGGLKSTLSVIDSNGNERISDYFELRDDELYPRRKIKLFMVTCNPEIARKDCLFYLVEPEN